MNKLRLTFGFNKTAMVEEDDNPTENEQDDLQGRSPEEDEEHGVSEVDLFLKRMHKESQRLQRSRKAHRKKPDALNTKLFEGCGSHVLKMVKDVSEKDKVVAPKPTKKKKTAKKTPQLPLILPKNSELLTVAPPKTKIKIRFHDNMPSVSTSVPLPIRLFREFDENGEEIRDNGYQDIEDSGYYRTNSLRYGSADGRVDDSFEIANRDRLEYLRLKQLMKQEEREEQLRLKKEQKKASRVLAPLPTPPQKANVSNKRRAQTCILGRGGPPAKKMKTEASTKVSQKAKEVVVPVADKPKPQKTRKTRTVPAKPVKEDTPVPEPKKTAGRRCKTVVLKSTEPTTRTTRSAAKKTPKPIATKAEEGRRVCSIVLPQKSTPEPKPKKKSQTMIIMRAFNPEMPVLRSRTKAAREAARPKDLDIPTLEAMADVQPLTPEGQDEVPPVLLNMDNEEVDRPAPIQNKANSYGGYKCITEAPAFPSPASVRSSISSSKAAVMKPIRIRKKPTKEELERSALLADSLREIRNGVCDPLTSKHEPANKLFNRNPEETNKVSKGVCIDPVEDTKNDTSVRNGSSRDQSLLDDESPPRKKYSRKNRSLGSPRPIPPSNNVNRPRFDPDEDMKNDPSVLSGSSSDDDLFDYLLPREASPGSHESCKTVSSEGWRDIVGEEAGPSVDRSLESIFGVSKGETGELIDLFPDEDDDESRLVDEKHESFSGENEEVADIQSLDFPVLRKWDEPDIWETTPSTSFNVKPAYSDASSSNSAKSSAALTPRRRFNDESNETSPVDASSWESAVSARPRHPLRRRRNSSSGEIFPFIDKNFASSSDPVIPSAIVSQQ